MKKSVAFYNALYHLYPFIDLLMALQRKKLAGTIGHMPPGNLLEIGTGRGTLLRLLHRHRCTGIDTSSRMLCVARKKTAPGGPSFRIMDGENLQFPDDHFDYVVLNHVLSVTEHPEQMLQEAYRVLQPGGILFLHNHFTPDNVLRYLDKCFAPVARLFHFRSFFHEEELLSLQRFEHRTTVATAPFQYFRLIILRK